MFQKNRLLRKWIAQAKATQVKNLQRSRRIGLRRLVIEGLETRALLAGDLIVGSLSDLQFDSSSNQYSYDAGYPAGARSRVTFASDLATLGASISIAADEIYVNRGIRIDTSSTTGGAGNIDLDAHTKVFISDRAELLANGIDDSKDGTITITASHDMLTQSYFSAANMVENLINAFTSPAEITILSGVTIDGGDVKLQTENGNHQLEKGSAFLDQVKKAWKVYAAASPVPSSIFSLPLTFQDWRPKAHISINQSITGSIDTRHQNPRFEFGHHRCGCPCQRCRQGGVRVCFSGWI